MKGDTMYYEVCAAASCSEVLGMGKDNRYSRAVVCKNTGNVFVIHLCHHHYIKHRAESQEGIRARGELHLAQSEKPSL